MVICVGHVSRLFELSTQPYSEGTCKFGIRIKLQIHLTRSLYWHVLESVFTGVNICAASILPADLVVWRLWPFFFLEMALLVEKL